jgi:predicted DCC family thiol-disulfide oxidoreductase YuxK
MMSEPATTAEKPAVTTKDPLWLSVWRYLNDNLALDFRSLALFRVGIGAIILVDLFFRAQDINVFYTDFGVLPRADFINFVGNIYQVSFHNANGFWQFQMILFCVAAFFAVMLMVGYRTRWATFASWLLLGSLHARNPSIFHSGDGLMRLMLFFGLFLPLGACYSVDKAMDNGENPRQGYKIFNGATLAFVGQVIIMYVFAAIAKKAVEWTDQGTAVWYALNIDQLVTPIGKLFLPYHDLLWLLSFGTLYLEALGPILFVAPVWSGPLRTLGVLLFVGLHIGFGLCLDLSIFAWIDSFVLMALMPSWFWDKVFMVFRHPRWTQLTMYYDGDCGFCQKVTRLLHTFFLLPQTRYAVAQDTPEMAAAMEANRSWVVVDWEGKKRFQFDGVIAVCEASPLLFWLAPVLKLPPIRGIGQAVYHLVAGNRMRVSPLLGCLSYKPVSWRTPVWASVLSFACIVYVFLWNWDIEHKPADQPFRLAPLGYGLQLSQGWAMFAPHPLKYDIWWVMPGELANGEKVDVYRQKIGAPSWEKPENLVYDFKNQRWRNYLTSLQSGLDLRAVGNLAQYYCRSWNIPKLEANDLDHRLSRFQIYMMKEVTPLPGQPFPPVEKQLLWTHDCLGLSQPSPGNLPTLPQQDEEEAE